MEVIGQVTQRWAGPCACPEETDGRTAATRRAAPEASNSTSSLSADHAGRPALATRGLSSCGLVLMENVGRTRPAEVASSRWTVSDPNITLPGADSAGWAESPGGVDDLTTCASGCSSPHLPLSGAPSIELRSAVREALLLVEGLRMQQERLLRRLDESGVTGVPTTPAAAGSHAAAAAAAHVAPAHCGPRSADAAALAAQQQQQRQHRFAHQCLSAGNHPHQPLSLSAVDSPACGQHQHQHLHQHQHQQQQHNSHLSHPQHQPQHLRINTTRCSPFLQYQQHPHSLHPQQQQLASMPGSGSGVRPNLPQHRSLHRPHHHRHLHLRACASGRSRAGFGSPGASPPSGRTPCAATATATVAHGSPGITFAGGSQAIPEDAAACMGAVVEVSSSCGGGGAGGPGSSAGGAGGGAGGLGSRRRSRLSLTPFGIELAEEEEARREQQLYTVCSAFATLAAAAAVDEPEDGLRADAAALRAFSSVAGTAAADGLSPPVSGGGVPRCMSVADVAPIIAAYSCATPLRLRAAAGVSAPGACGAAGGTCSGADERGAALCGSDDGEEDQEQYGWLYSSDDEEDVDRPSRASAAPPPPPASGAGAGTSQPPSRFSWVKLFTAPLRAFPGVSGLDEDAEHVSAFKGPAQGEAAGGAAGGGGGQAACATPPLSQPPPQRTASTKAGAAGASGSGVAGDSKDSAAGSGVRSETLSSWATQLTRSNSRGNSRSGVRSDGSECQDNPQGAADRAAGSPAAPRERAVAVTGPDASAPAGGDAGVGHNSCGGEAAGRPAPRLSLFSEGGGGASRRKLQVSTAGADTSAAGGTPTTPAVPSRYSWRRLTRN